MVVPSFFQVRQVWWFRVFRCAKRGGSDLLLSAPGVVVPSFFEVRQVWWFRPFRCAKRVGSDLLSGAPSVVVPSFLQVRPRGIEPENVTVCLS